MSRASLSIAVGALLLLFCVPAVSHLAAGPRPVTSHRELTCVACHDGALSERERPHVPSAVCTECHEAASLAVGRNGFEHATHADIGPVPMGCAGCHSHSVGDEPLAPGTGTCGLCHRSDLEDRGGDACRKCHEGLPATVRTSQGMPLPHGGFDWMEDACLRCHYQVSAAPSPAGGCDACHGEEAFAGVGAFAGVAGTRPDGAAFGDVHESHLQVACGSCHATDAHRIEAMSTAIDLRCDVCHDRPHRLDDPSIASADELCNGCHRPVHVAQQRLLLGVVGGEFGSASEKFVSGLGCGSCHAAGADSVEGASGSMGGACGACHSAPYDLVPSWWSTGGVDRATAVLEYAEGGRSALSAAGLDEELGELDEALEWARRVAEGNAAHNVVLSHRLLEAALAAAEDAYLEAGTVAPFPPVLGREPRPGLCSYCHYDMPFEGPERRLGPPDDFHLSLRDRARR